MPRTAREKSKTDIYHVMLRGIDKRDIFLTNSDYEKFLYYIEKTMEKSQFQIYAYCLMTNHLHILIKTGTEEIGDTIRRIAVGYAQYFNIKNGRTGHLFQNRFKSEPVNDDSYFLTVLRYIHQNPIKAGIVEDIEDYKWSSYNEYLIERENKLINSTFAMEFFQDIKAFKEYMLEENQDKCLECNEKARYTDVELKQLIMSIIPILKLKKLNKKPRDEMLKIIKDTTRASNRQLSRVTEIGRSIWENVK